MAGVLYVADAVVTGEQLRRLHTGQTTVCFGPRTVVTPTAWDYVRQARLDASRGEAPAVVAGGSAAPASAASGEGLISEIRPAQLVAEGRCDHPDQPCGCQTDEFGSGYADGVARGQDLEALVQRITDLVMEELRRTPPRP